jgi:predicted nucleic acid-binding protein
LRFWDASAIVPLAVDEPARPSAERAFRDDPHMVVWWAAEIECVSAIARLERADLLSHVQVAEAIERLEDLKAAWDEVDPVDEVRRIARRLLRVHALRAADSLQLAAAIVGSEDDPSTLDLVSLDERLVEAARREGFSIAGL